MRSSCSAVGVMKRAPRGSLATLTKPGQRLPAPHSADGPAFQDHGRTVGHAFGVDRLEVPLGIEVQRIQNVACLQCQRRALGIPDDRSALEILDGAMAGVGAHDEHAGARVHGADHLEIGRRAFLGVEELLRHLAEHQADIELAFLQQRHVLDAAARRYGLDAERRTGPFDRVDEGACIDDESTAFGRRAELQAARLRRAITDHHAGRRQPGQHRTPPQAARFCLRRRARPHADATTGPRPYPRRFDTMPRSDA